ncbi:hypothetical protein Trichorick_01456 (plasmid) [Candidatus Trichorickettsia mobilis]|uniref:Uncharacterized protein n=1 Tax=Candidatus Trichorickettsia mobilis TaxID=1346319 RepID=A0ABZ0UV73_9RICK|nr:hypothetical protein [Candidatus Trichorickettsia mobilis]WPY01543.1 hypothetical protein Trichorick_01456 [Candidatus Trichorickettsia mobilis]
MKTKKALSNTFDVVYYFRSTGNIYTCFDRYPDWLNAWIETNKNKFIMHYQVHNLPDVSWVDDVGIIVHDFNVGDCLICTDNNIVEIGQKALYNMMCRINGIDITTPISNQAENVDLLEMNIQPNTEVSVTETIPDLL